jgi:hypothetical protein
LNRYADEALLSNLADEVSALKFSKRDVRFELEKLERFVLDAVREYHEDEKEDGETSSEEEDTSSGEEESSSASEDETTSPTKPTDTITETMQSLRLNTTTPPPKTPLIQVLESVDNE